MLRILVVEDDIHKKQKICQVIAEVDERLESSIDFVTDVHDAKKSLKRTKYAVLILDINIPLKSNGLVTAGAGLEILRFIRDNDAAITPAYIVGLTAFDVELSKEVPEIIWKLLSFSNINDSWKNQLKGILGFAKKIMFPPFQYDGSSFHVDLCVVVALEKEELTSILDLPGNWEQIVTPHDSTHYWRGTFARGGRSLSVVVAAAELMGMANAAILTTKMIHSFRPRYILMAGICAGVKGKADIGDIIIADPCFDLGSGKWVALTITEEPRFKPALYPWRVDARLTGGAKSVAAKNNLLIDIRNSFEGDRPLHPPEVIVGPLASGASVLQASSLMEDARDIHKNLIGVDMEVFGVHSAAEYASEPKPKCITMKSVCDFGCEIKNDIYHKYAAYCSARFLYEFALDNLVDDI